MRLSPLYALITAALFLQGNATAAVTIYTDDVALQQNQGDKQFFSQSGLSPEQPEVIPGAGDQMALSLVSSLIIPKSWKIESSGNFESSAVSWKGGLSWPLILNDIAQREQIFISLDWVRKIAAIHVPGERGQLAQTNAEQAQKALEAQNAFEAGKDAERMEKRERVESRANNDRAQLDMLMAKAREAEEANQQFISRLNERNQRAEADNQTLRDMLEKELSSRKALEERYKVIDPTLANNSGKAADATELFMEHQGRWVLPFDPSFDYFIKGGHTDIISMDTPATYIARSGTVEAVIEKWCEAVGCFVDYRAGVQHDNQYEIELKGNFIQASTNLISIFEKSQRPLKIDFFPDVKHDGKKGLVIISDLNFKKPQ